MTSTHYDVLIIGSGFGGSVTAMRLAEKGYRVGVLEAGKRYDTDDPRPRSSTIHSGRISPTGTPSWIRTTGRHGRCWVSRRTPT